MNGFQKIDKGIEDKNSRLVLGLDPTAVELEELAKQGIDVYEYYKNMIDEALPFIIGIKPNLAFYEHSEQTRGVMAKLMAYARSKGLVTIMDAKRGDIMDTQKAMSVADVKNFNPDIVTLHSYSGREGVQPFLDVNPDMCAYIMAAMSPKTATLQELTANGIKIAAQVALDAHQYGNGRIGLVVGATKEDSLKHIRMVETEYGLQHMPVLAPGLGKQGGVPMADMNTVYPISSAFTKEEYRTVDDGKGGKRVMGIAETAEMWRDKINEEVAKYQESDNMKTAVVNRLIAADPGRFIKLNQEPELESTFLLKKGRNKIEQKFGKLPTDKEEQVVWIREALKDRVIVENDMTRIFCNLRDVCGLEEQDQEVVDWMAHLYAKQILDTEKQLGVKMDKIGITPFGALGAGIPAARILKRPHFILRPEVKATHDQAVGGIKTKLATPERPCRIGMVEDVVTSAGSVLEQVKTARELGGESVVVEDAFAFVKRPEEDCVGLCAAQGVRLHTQMDFDYLKHILKNSPHVSKEFKELI